MADSDNESDTSTSSSEKGVGFINSAMSMEQKTKLAIKQWKKADTFRRALIAKKRDALARINVLIKKQEDIMHLCTPLIEQFMKDNNITGMDFPTGGGIRLVRSERRSAYKKDTMKNALQEIIDKPEDVERILVALEGSRPARVSTTLKGKVMHLEQPLPTAGAGK